MRRGEIWLVAGGVYASKPRPALIVQDDRFDGTESVVVCPCTTYDVEAPLFRVPIPADDRTGLDADSFLMVDKLTTVRRSKVTERVGRVTASQLVEFERRAVVFLGIAG